ncbi:MAG TPA: glycoside-pentoside-hexuronide (GPH):cation symporter [Clostridia bacterium]|nr:glycoside-pentoside-hexuronide (GPH):cation symporter [Clostridia bacterium]HPO54011.1 glycoside-pentoside-hexuronide (GPH):cation symporter [Clostridia bacterium]
MEGSVNKKYLRKRDYITFSMARFAASAISGLAQGYLLIFYTSVLGIEPITVGVMFLISKIFDGLNDPVMGTIVDKTRSRWGKMRPYIIFGSIPFGIIAIMLFLPVTSMPSSFKVFYMYFTYFCYDIFGTMVGVPLDGLPALVSPNSDERAKLISVSRVVGSVGDQSALVLFSLFMMFLKLKYTLMSIGIVIGVLAPVFLILGAVNVKERIPPSEENIKIADGFRYLFRNKQFLSMICSNLLTFFRNLVSASIVYVVTYIYFNGSLNIAFALPGAVASMLGMLFTPKLKRKLDSKQLFILATVFHSVALAIVFIVGYEVHWIITSLLMFFAMLPVGILNVVPHLMAIDTLDYWEDKTGKRQEGVCFAVMSLRSKVSSAFKDFFLSWLLSFFLFAVPLTSITDHSPMQYRFTQKGIFMIFTIIPAVLNLVSIVPLIFYKLDKKTMGEINLRLSEKRKASFEAASGGQNE